MKKIFLLAGLLLVLFFSGCSHATTPNNSSDQQEQNQTPIALVEPQVAPAEPQQEISDSLVPLKEFSVSEIGVTLQIPSDYEIEKSSETNRRGSFVSYNFLKKGALPLLNEIQFFSEESIRAFTENCSAGPCFFGDYPDLARYMGQKNAFKEQKNYLGYTLKKFGDSSYFVSNFQSRGDSVVIREYTTFINDTKVDVWIGMDNESQIEKADALFQNFHIGANDN